MAVLSGSVAWSLGRDGLLGGWRDLVTSDMLEVSSVNGAFAMAYQVLVDGEAPTEACRAAREAVNSATGSNGVQTMLAAHLIMTLLVSEAAREERGQAVCLGRGDAEPLVANLERVWRREVYAARWSLGEGASSYANPFGRDGFALRLSTDRFNSANGEVYRARIDGVDPGALSLIEAERDKLYAKMEEAQKRYWTAAAPSSAAILQGAPRQGE